MWIMKNNIVILLISKQKLYFGDYDAIYDVIIQYPLWYSHEICAAFSKASARERSPTEQ